MVPNLSQSQAHRLSNHLRVRTLIQPSLLDDMGSLMAGWDSPVLAQDTEVRVMRNRSLTKEEVEAFWRQQRGANKQPADKDGAGEMITSDKIDAAAAAAGGGEISAPSKSRDWWTRSSWAFLNEPPLEEAPGKAQRYTPQFHVARMATAGDGGHGA